MPKSDDYTSLLPIFEDSLEINNQLPPKEKQRRIDKRTDILATILALYPTTPRKDLAREFKLTVHYIQQLANRYGLHKMPRHIVQKIVDGQVQTTYPSLSAASKAEGIKWKYLKSKIDANEPINGALFKIIQK